MIEPSNPQAIAEQVVPYYPEDSKKSKYLSYRVAGFLVMESVQLSGIHHKTLLRWRESDPTFRAIDLNEEGKMDEVRKTLSSRYLDIEFTRNFRLVLEKDFQVLYKSVINQPLTDHEQAYLLKLRSHYTPQQLAMIKQLLAGGSLQQPFDYTRLAITIRRERESVEIKTEQ